MAVTRLVRVIGSQGGGGKRGRGSPVLEGQRWEAVAWQWATEQADGGLMLAVGRRGASG